jgi:hypothetical protein
MSDKVAGTRNGSPGGRKNESTVFAHLTETYGRDTLKRKEVDIQKPRVVGGNPSVNYGNQIGSNPIGYPSSASL